MLLAPDGFASPGFEYDKPAQVPAILGVMRWVFPRALLRANLAPAYAHPDAVSDSITQRYYDLMRAPGNRQALLAVLQQTMLTDPVPRLRIITAPTLLVWGVSDQILPVANAQNYLKVLPYASLVTLPNVGHVPSGSTGEDARVGARVPVAGRWQSEPVSDAVPGVKISASIQRSQRPSTPHLVSPTNTPDSPCHP